jgi:hypothetical protein
VVNPVASVPGASFFFIFYNPLGASLCFFYLAQNLLNPHLDGNRFHRRRCNQA